MNKDKENLSAGEFDRIFDEGKEDITPYLDLNSATRINKEAKRVNVDFPAWMVEALDKEAAHLGVSRQALVKVWIANCLTHTAHTAPRV